jgi:hypothetical protein
MAAKKPSSPTDRSRKARTPVVPDQVDFRDRLYSPSVRSRPPTEKWPDKRIPVLNQGQTNACTGFALASVVHWLQAGSTQKERVSPFMLYSMARRYDEFPGAKSDTGSSLRGALKGWHKHGACSQRRWPGMPMPEVPEDPKDDWWGDAMRRPLGAYYRVDSKAISDMHVALDEVGILYASVVCHAGWDEGYKKAKTADKCWTIPHRPVSPADGGHAFVIVGYTEAGFIIQNSWGTGWGTSGYAILTYQDWRENAMDCWVVQMGVATALHLAIAEASTLRRVAGKVEVAEDEKLRNHEIAPFIVNMENNGELSDSGDFRTQPGDLEALVTTYLERAREEWKLRSTQAVDIAIYAHGGLVSEGDAAKAAAKWIPALYQRNIFPIFLMWETGLVSTLANMVKDWLAPEDERKRTAGALSKWWDTRLERLLARPGTAIWGEMKQNGAAISTGKNSGGLTLYHYARQSKVFDPKRDRIHLIGHSAGSIVHCHLAEVLARKGWTFSTANMMAPAATMQLFSEKMLPLIKDRRVGQFHQWHLSDPLEEGDKTCRAIIGYGRSLLYLVSESFEGGSRTEILGMQKYFNKLNGARNLRGWAADSPQTHSTSHGGFDNDDATMNSVIRQIESSR